MSDTDSLMIFTDGGSRGNPGPGACAFVIHFSGRLVYQQSFLLGHTTNNQAEYSAVIYALNYLNTSSLSVISNVRLIQIKSDSQLMVSQLSGLFKIKDVKLQQLVIKVKQLEKEIINKYPGISILYSYIPRSENYVADRLLNQALDSNT